MPLDFNNPFLQQKIVKEADEKLKNVYSNDFARRSEGIKIITEQLKQVEKDKPK